MITRWLLLLLCAACGVGQNLGPAPASLWIIAPWNADLSVTVHSAYGDTTVIPPACLRWSELYIAPVLEIEYGGRRLRVPGPFLWPGELPNAQAVVFADSTGIVVQVTAVTGALRC